MWDSDSSDSEPDTNVVVGRCSYCGTFCRTDQIIEASGLCLKCDANMAPETKNRRTQAEAALARMAAVEVEDDSSSEEISSIRSEDVDEEQGTVTKGSAVGAERTETSNLCPRCWKNPATTVLYNTPICEDCYQVAQQKRETAKGTKKRYQPPTPALAPGKKLTRVCDDCRRKRKRCQHRRVVDENDPEADKRRKRVKREHPLAEMAEDQEERQEERQDEGESPSSAIEVDDAESGSPASSSEASPPKKARLCPETEGWAYTNLKTAIRDSVRKVNRRELERLFAVAELKQAEYEEALDAVKKHMEGWVTQIDNLRDREMSEDE